MSRRGVLLIGIALQLLGVAATMAAVLAARGELLSDVGCVMLLVATLTSVVIPWVLAFRGRRTT
jgi:hypothetical protein